MFIPLTTRYFMSSAILACALLAVLAGNALGFDPITDAVTGQPVMYPSYVTVFDGQLFFRGNLSSEGSVTSLWQSNGSNAWRIANTGPGGAIHDASYITPHNGLLYFEGSGVSGPPKLWQYSPGSGVALAPGSSSNLQNPEEMTGYGGNLYFRAARFGAPSNIGIELWKFDGTNQTPIEMFPGSGSSYPQHFIEYSGQLYFNACGAAGQGTELWRYNGSGMPTNAATIYPNNGSSPENFAVFGGDLYFSAYDGVHGRELWRYNESSGATLAADIVPGGQYSSSNPNNLAVYNGKLYFSAADSVHGYELWSYDGTTAQMVAEINPTPDPGNGDTFLMDSSPAELTVFNNKLYFSADDGVHGRELWSFDGTSVSLVDDINPGPYGSGPSELTVYNNKLYFSADSVFVPGVTTFQPRAFALPVPEPSSLTLLAVAGLAILFYVCKQPRPTIHV
jgi:ELWxxDGT repeat protein